MKLRAQEEKTDGNQVNQLYIRTQLSAVEKDEARKGGRVPAMTEDWAAINFKKAGSRKPHCGGEGVGT